MSHRPAHSRSAFEPFALSVGALPAFIGYNGVATFAIPVYQMTLGVDPVLLGLVLGLPRVWEAFADPLVGNLSDNLRTRWGRRRPLIVVGAVMMGLIYGCTWMVGNDWSRHAQLAYFIGASILFFSAYTLFSVPYASLTYEMTPDYHERTRVMARCSLFNKAGELGQQWIFPMSQLAIFGGGLVGVRVAGWLVGLVVLTGLGIVPGLLVRERFGAPVTQRRRVAFWASLRAAAASRSFRIIAGVSLLSIAMGVLTTSLDYYVLVYYLFRGDIAVGAVWKGALTSGYAIVGIAFIPLVVALATRWGKRNTLAAFYALAAIGGVMKWFLFNPAHPGLILLDPLLCGGMWVASNVLFSSMLADLCDEDELQSGQRREGMFSSAFSSLQKAAVSGFMVVAGLALAAAGFKSTLGGQQAATTFTALRLMLAASTALPPLACLLLLRGYNVDAAQAARTRACLEERRSGRPAGVPLENR